MASSSPTIEIINNVGQNDNRNKGPGAWVGWLIFFVVVILLFGVLPYFCATDFKFEFSKWAGWEKIKKWVATVDIFKEHQSISEWLVLFVPVLNVIAIKNAPS